MLVAFYKHLLPGMGGYICNEGAVDLARVETLVSRIALGESAIFRARARNEERFEMFKLQKATQTAVGSAAAEGGEAGAVEDSGGGSSFHDEGGGGSALVARLEMLTLAHNESLAALSGDAVVQLDKPGFKERYYSVKGIGGKESQRSLVEEYVRGLCWVCQYYTQGVPSWGKSSSQHTTINACEWGKNSAVTWSVK